MPNILALPRTSSAINSETKELEHAVPLRVLFKMPFNRTRRHVVATLDGFWVSCSCLHFQAPAGGLNGFWSIPDPEAGSPGTGRGREPRVFGLLLRA